MTVTVICDFDGTIACEDVTDGLLERFANASWREVEAQWLAGEFGSRECMARQIALIDASADELDAYLDSLQIDSSFPAFVAACERRDDVTLHVVSDGIDYAITRILRRHGLGRLPLTANAIARLPGNRYRLDFPHASAGCRVASGTCKCAVGRIDAHAGKLRQPTLVIGDGTSDFCVASRADFTFAKDGLLDYCRANAIPHLPFESFADVERSFAHVVESLFGSANPVRLFTEITSDA